MDLRCDLLLGLITGIVLSIQAQDPRFSNQNAYRVEPYQVNPPGLEEERQKLMYPYDKGDYITDLGVVRSLHQVFFPCRLTFFGFDYSYMMIHKDGYITFNRGLVSYDFPIEFPVHVSDPLREEDPSMIAPWLSQQDIPRGIPEAGVYFRFVDLQKESNVTLRERLLRDFREGMIGANQFTARCVMIVTWKNVTFANPQSHRPVKTNTYQAVLATDEKNTYAMFNYEWISWITHMDNYDGMKGPQSYVGFNAGNMTRSFEFKPYSQRPDIYTLADGGFANGIKGRHIFQIDEEIFSGSCIEKDMDPNWNDRPLYFFPRSGSLLGGTLVNITGPCFPKNKKTVEVTFHHTKVQCLVQDENLATCISPPVMYSGYIDISVSLDSNQQTYHRGRFYIYSPDRLREDIRPDGNERRVEPEMIEVTWKPSILSWNQTTPVRLHLWGYRETSGYPNLTYITELVSEDVKLRDGRFVIEVEQFQTRNDKGKTDLTFGFISMNLSDANALESPVFWSRPTPLAWYFKPQWDREYGTDLWRDRQCLNWHQRDVHRGGFVHTIARCPCTIEQAKRDIGRFQPSTSCNVIDRDCDEAFFKGVHACFHSATTAMGGAGQTCCYDNDGELIKNADIMSGGRPSRAFKFGKHPYNQPMMVPILSHWLHDVMPLFFCCTWHPDGDNSDTCQKFISQRTSQDCSSYSSPGVGFVFGDPHFLTFDGVNYTFNGRGEFVLARVEDKYHAMDIQARFEQISGRLRSEPAINGTVLTAIVARDNMSSVIEFRLRPEAARWRYHLYVIVDGEYIFPLQEKWHSQTFRGVSIYQPPGIWNMSHIVATFDSGAGVEVKSGNGYMSANVFLPTSFKGKTRGLLSNWTDRESDDFTTPNGQVLVTANDTTGKIHEHFGMHWRLTEEDRKNIGESLFDHDAAPFAYYDDPHFQPEFGNPPSITDAFHHYPQAVNQVCSSSMACRFDLIVTGNVDLAKMTKQQEQDAKHLARSLRETEIRCPALPRPRHGRKSDIGYYVGSEVHFICDEGYELVGAQSRKCMPNGQWTWGLDTECIESDRRR